MGLPITDMVMKKKILQLFDFIEELTDLNEETSSCLNMPPVVYFITEVNASLAKSPLKFGGGLADLGLTS